MTDPTRTIPIEPPARQFEAAAQLTTVQEPDTAHQPTPSEAVSARSRSAPNLTGRMIMLIAAGGVATLLLVGVGIYWAWPASPVAAPPVERKSPLESARDRCGSSFGNDAVLGDKGRTLTLRGDGKKSSGLSFSKLECYWSELKMPDSVRQEVLATRALDGRQSGGWEGIHVSWSYHPDSGLQMVITVSD